MNEQTLINRIAAIEAFADALKIKATGLKEDLIRFYGSAPKRGRGLSEAEKAKLIGNRRKRILKK